MRCGQGLGVHAESGRRRSTLIGACTVGAHAEGGAKEGPPAVRGCGCAMASSPKAASAPPPPAAPPPPPAAMAALAGPPAAPPPVPAAPPFDAAGDGGVRAAGNVTAAAASASTGPKQRSTCQEQSRRPVLLTAQHLPGSIKEARTACAEDARTASGPSTSKCNPLSASAIARQGKHGRSHCCCLTHCSTRLAARTCLQRPLTMSHSPASPCPAATHTRGQPLLPRWTPAPALPAAAAPLTRAGGPVASASASVGQRSGCCQVCTHCWKRTSHRLRKPRLLPAWACGQKATQRAGGTGCKGAGGSEEAGAGMPALLPLRSTLFVILHHQPNLACQGPYQPPCRQSAPSTGLLGRNKDQFTGLGHIAQTSPGLRYNTLDRAQRTPVSPVMIHAAAGEGSANRCSGRPRAGAAGSAQASRCVRVSQAHTPPRCVTYNNRLGPQGATCAGRGIALAKWECKWECRCGPQPAWAQVGKLGGGKSVAGRAGYNHPSRVHTETDKAVSSGVSIPAYRTSRMAPCPGDSSRTATTPAQAGRQAVATGYGMRKQAALGERLDSTGIAWARTAAPRPHQATPAMCLALREALSATARLYGTILTTQCCSETTKRLHSIPPPPPISPVYLSGSPAWRVVYSGRHRCSEPLLLPLATVVPEL